jgi:hypothetical protein
MQYFHVYSLPTPLDASQWEGGVRLSINISLVVFLECSTIFYLLHCLLRVLCVRCDIAIHIGQPHFEEQIGSQQLVPSQPPGKTLRFAFPSRHSQSFDLVKPVFSQQRSVEAKSLSNFTDHFIKLSICLST